MIQFQPLFSLEVPADEVRTYDLRDREVMTFEVRHRRQSLYDSTMLTPLVDGQVRLPGVPAYTQMATNTDASDDSLKLGAAEILELIEKNIGAIERDAAQERRRVELNLSLALKLPVRILPRYEVGYEIVVWPFEGFDFFLKGTGQEADVSGRYGGAKDDDLVNLLAEEKLEPSGQTSVGLGGTGRTGEEKEV